MSVWITYAAMVRTVLAAIIERNVNVCRAILESLATRSARVRPICVNRIASVVGIRYAPLLERESRIVCLCVSLLNAVQMLNALPTTIAAVVNAKRAFKAILKTCRAAVRLKTNALRIQNAKAMKFVD